jgi:hypothetical protein
MIQILGPLALVFCASDLAPEAPTHPLMAAVPADAIFVASCDDPASLRANILSSQMVRLFDGGSGTPYVDAVVDLILSQPDGQDALSGFELGKRLVEGFDGPTVAFFNTSSAGFLTTSPDGGGSIRSALDQLFAQLPEAQFKDEGTHQGFQLQSIHPDPNDRGVMIRAEANGITGLFIGNGSGTVIETAKDSIRRYIAQAQSDIARELETSRLANGAKGSRSALDFLFDISFAARLSGKSQLSDIGLTEDCWLYGRLDIGGPTQSEVLMDVRLPQTGPIPTFLDVLTPVTKDDLRLIPDYALSFSAARIDLELLLERVIEVGGTEAKDGLEQARAASIGATGRDLVDDLFLGMTGYFATYEVEPPKAPFDLSSLLASQGVFAIGVHDSEEMLEVFDDLVSVGGVDSMIDFRDYKDVEVWVIEVDPSITPAIAFMEGHLLISPNLAHIERAIDHAMTAGAQSILDAEAGRQIIEFGSEGFLVSFQDTALGAWKILGQAATIADLSPELSFLKNMPQMDLSDVRREIRGSSIGAVIRTASGLQYRAESR